MKRGSLLIIWLFTSCTPSSKPDQVAALPHTILNMDTLRQPIDSLPCQGKIVFRTFSGPFDSLFSPISLPFCSKYEKSEVNFAESKTEENPWEGKESLAEGYVRKYVSSGLSSTSRLDYWDFNEVKLEYDSNDLYQFPIYPKYLVAKTTGFTAIIYEELSYDKRFEHLFCTYNREGQLISSMVIGYHGFQGTYLTEDGAREAFYDERSYCIDKELTININDHRNENKQLHVSSCGKIEVVKQIRNE